MYTLAWSHGLNFLDFLEQFCMLSAFDKFIIFPIIASSVLQSLLLHSPSGTLSD